MSSTQLLSKKAYEIRELIFSFRKSKFYDVKVKNLLFAISTKPHLRDTNRDHFCINIQIESAGSFLATLVPTETVWRSNDLSGKYGPSLMNDAVCFINRLAGNKQSLVMRSADWMPVEPLTPKGSFRTKFDKEWMVSEETIVEFYDETIQILRMAKELEKQGLYFKGRWTPSVARKIWIFDPYLSVSYTISRKEARRLLSNLYLSRVWQVLAERYSTSTDSTFRGYSIDARKMKKTVSHFVKETMLEKRSVYQVLRDGDITIRVKNDLFESDCSPVSLKVEE